MGQQEIGVLWLQYVQVFNKHTHKNKKLLN